MISTKKLSEAYSKSKAWSFILYFVFFYVLILLLPYISNFFTAWINQIWLTRFLGYFVSYVIFVTIVPYLIDILINMIKR